MSIFKTLFRSRNSKAKLNMDVAIDNFGVWSPGPPTLATVEPGTCQFGEEFQKVFLKTKLQISPDTYVFTFTTPDESKPLNLSTCACVLAKTTAEDGTDIIRPYTPCSTNETVGEFQLMVKIYNDGKMTQHLQSMKMGDQLEFKHIEFNVKIQYPFGKRFIGMMVGGTGITPMIQALHALLGNKEDTTQVGMLYGSRNSGNILGKATLDQWSKAHERLTVTHVLSHEPEDSPWIGERGFISKELVQKHFPSPADDVLIFVCGPPPMYNFLCGPRDDKENITGTLGELGYTKDQVYKF